MNKTPNFPKYQVVEVLQFLYDILTFCDKSDPDKLLTNEVSELRSLTLEMNSLFRLKKGSALSKEIINLDKLNDKFLIGIKMNATSLTYHFDPAISKAATLIVKSIEAFGKDIPKQNLLAQTSIINAIYSNWNIVPNLASAIITLSLREWTVELKRINDQFRTTHMKRTDEASLLPAGTTVEKRKDAIEAYCKLITKLDSYINLSNNETYIDLRNINNEIIRSYNLIVERRNNGDKDNDSTPPAVS